MSRNTWTMYTSTDNGESWDSDGTIYRPNESLTLGIISTLQTVALANGDQGFITPETKYNRDGLTFRWLGIDEGDSLISKIDNYVINQNYCKIVDHNAAEYIGKFSAVRRVWLSGIEDSYDIEANFVRFD